MRNLVDTFSRAYQKATPDEQAALRAWMRNIILPGKVRRKDMSRIRRSEKESIEARDRRILEFPRTMSPREVAKAVRAEGLYSSKTTVYHIEHRVRRLRAEGQSVERNGSSS
jgi:hypothetical protein